MTRTPALEGGCQCGRVRYALYSRPTGSFCHCRMCQRATGGVFAALTWLPKADFAWTRGEPAVFASSSVATRAFCRDCGTPLTFTYNDTDGTNVTMGSLDDPEQANMSGHYGVESRVSWLRLCDGLPEERTGDGEGDGRLDGMVSHQSSADAGNAEMTDWRDDLPAVRGKLLRDEPLGPYTWFRVGGAADALFIPADPEDLAAFLKALDPAVPVTVLGVGSNVIVRDGGVEGVVIRLAGRSFAGVAADGDTITAGAGALDSMVAKASAKAGVAGLEFYAGIPGTIGGALTMNAGCYGAETRDVLVSAWGLTRAGERVDYALADFGYAYRHSEAPADIIWIEAVYRGTPDAPEAVAARIAEITSRREQTQPIREKTGGSTFKNPDGHSSWKLVDEAGWRGRLHAVTGGGAKFSELHSNFMINPGEATAADLEGLGEAVRADVLAKTGVQLEWEIRRIGRPA